MLSRRSLLAAGFAAPALAAPRRGRHVVIISIDGFSAFSLRDETLPLPTVRRLARLGAAAGAMTPVNPTVTWPNHTSMVTGVTPARHGVLYNGLPVRPAPGAPLKVEPWAPKSELVLAPTLYDAAHAARLTTAEVDWVAIHNAATITHAFPEVPRLTDPIVREMIAAGKLTERQAEDFRKFNILLRDEIWTQAAEHIIGKHKPNLLLFHLLTTDSAQHRYGAENMPGNTALTLADAKVQRILDALARAGIARRTTVLIVSDHGFKTYTKVIQPNALAAREGLGGAVWSIPEGGTAMVYVTREERKAELLPRLTRTFAALEGVARVIEPGEFAALGYPPKPDARMPELVLAAKDGYAFSGAVSGEAVVPTPAPAGAHGYLNTDPAMDAVFVASGAGIRPGARLDRVRTIDIAPTAARLLGLDLPNVEGRVLSEILL